MVYIVAYDSCSNCINDRYSKWFENIGLEENVYSMASSHGLDIHPI